MNEKILNSSINAIKNFRISKDLFNCNDIQNPKEIITGIYNPKC